MKKIILLILLFLPIASFAEETTDDMTTIFEEHFDGWFNLHTSGMNATYAYTSASLQSLKNSTTTDGLPCLKLGIFSVTFYNNMEVYGDVILSFKDYKNDITVTLSQGNSKKKLKANNDGTYTINVKNKQVTLSFEGASTSSYIDDIVLKAPTSLIKISPSADLSFGQSEMTADLGTTYSSLELLLNPHDLPVKWYSSNQAIATVDESGNVTPHFIGTTTIYAIFEGNDEYAYQAASYQLTTTREPLTNEVYYDGFAGYIGSGGNGGNFEDNSYVGDFDYTYAFTVVDNSSSLLKGYQCLEVEKEYTIDDLEKIGVKNGNLNFRYALSSSSSKTPVTVTVKYSDNNEFVLIDDLTQREWCDICIPLSSTSQLSSISFSGKKFFLDEISIISNDYVTIGSTGYATLYYSGRALKVPTGIKAYTMKVEDGKIVRSRTYSEGETLPKATAVVLRGTAGDYPLGNSTEDGVVDDDNQLKGSDTKTSTIGNDGDKFYMLANKEGVGVGYYWGAQNGAAFLNGEHKAYLAIPATDIKGSAAKSGYVFTEDGATAISKVDAPESKSESYTLDGKRCQQGFKGIVISNGRKTIKR